jgi:hypothetical protein
MFDHCGYHIAGIDETNDDVRVRCCKDSKYLVCKSLPDVFVSEPRFIKGTLASFEIDRNSRTRLENVFAEFAPEKYDFQFQKTRVLVKLLRQDYISRSEAKRLMHNLDKFSEIELDMRDVQNLGQGFADEVFRVFATAHPNIVIRFINASDVVTAMIKHVSSCEAVGSAVIPGQGVNHVSGTDTPAYADFFNLAEKNRTSHSFSDSCAPWLATAGTDQVRAGQCRCTEPLATAICRGRAE